MTIEIFPRRNGYFPTDLFPDFKQAANGAYLFSSSDKEIRRYAKKAKSMRFYFLCYEDKYGRGSNCRWQFIKANPPGKDGKYRCVYCGKKIKKEKMCVDHIIPVGAAKRSASIQRRLPKGVNDLSNLAPSCVRCNMKKLDSTFVGWSIKAALGKHEAYWVLRGILFLCIVCAAIYFVIRYQTNYKIDIIQDAWYYLNAVKQYLFELSCMLKNGNVVG